MTSSVENKKVTFLAGLLSPFVAVGTILVLGLLALWAGYAVSVVWGWYAVPIFGAPPLAWWEAAGLLLLCTAVRGDRVRPDAEDPPVKKHIVHLVLYPVFLLLFGWFYRVVGGAA